MNSLNQAPNEPFRTSPKATATVLVREPLLGTSENDGETGSTSAHKNTQLKSETMFNKQNKNLVNVSGATKVALNGYDPVSFFEETPANGDFNISTKHQGAVYYFTTKEHKKLFDSNPEKYAPQHGGFCSYGVSVGALFPVDVGTAQVYKDKLYVNLNASIQEMFNKDLDNVIAKADKNWPKLSQKHI